MTSAHVLYGDSFLDEEARNRLLLEQLPQVRYIARRIHERLPQHVPFEDLVDAGVLGLIDAFGKYDDAKNVQFKSYASFRIRGAILDSLRDLDWSPRDLRRKARQMTEANGRLSAELGRNPTEQELANDLKVTLDEFQQMLIEIGGLGLNSLQVVSSTTETGEDLAENTPADSDDNPFARFAKGESKELLANAISELSEKEQQVLALYYFEELTMKEVGAVLGIGESRVSQIHSLALLRLRSRLQSKSSQRRMTGKSSSEATWKRF